MLQFIIGDATSDILRRERNIFKTYLFFLRAKIGKDELLSFYFFLISLRIATPPQKRKKKIESLFGLLHELK